MRTLTLCAVALALLTTVCPAAEPKIGYIWPDSMAWTKDAPQHFVHPEGRPDNTGAADSPWDYRSVLEGRHPIAPGSIIWLREGTYGRGGANEVRCNLKGTPERPVIVRGYPGELATLDGGITMHRNTTGEHVWFWGFEMMNSDLSRSTGTRRPCGFNVSRPGVSMINMIVHDVGHGPFSYWVEVGTAEVHGCLLWGSGFYDMSDVWQGNPRGSGFYTQNKDGVRRLTDNISFRQFTNAMKCWSHRGYVQGYHIEGNVLFDTGMWNLMVSTSKFPLERIVIRDNFMYRKPLDYGGSVLLGAYGGVIKDAVIRGNTIIASDAADEAIKIGKFEWLDIAGNTFYGQVNGILQSDFRDNRFLTERPKGLQITTRPNKYQPGRGHVIVYNWDKLPYVEADLSRILPDGTPYEVRDAQNYFGRPAAKGVFDGTPVKLPMNMTKVAQPVGDVPHIRHRFNHTAPEFAVFVVIPRGGLGPLTKLAPQIEKQKLAIVPAGGVFVGQVDVRLDVPKGMKAYVNDGTKYVRPGAMENMWPYAGPVTLRSSRRVMAAGSGDGDKRPQSVTAYFRIVPEMDPPVRSEAKPQGVLAGVPGDGRVHLSLKTDEPATCRFALKAGVAYADMENTFATTGGVEHTHPLDGLKAGDVRTVFVKAADQHGNANIDDYEIAVCVPDAHVPFKAEMEAEAAKLTGAVLVRKDPDRSGGEYVTVAGGMTGTARIAFEFETPCAGAYIVWGRVWGRNSGADSLRVTVDGGAEDIYDIDERNRTKQWRWSVMNGRGLTGKRRPLTLEPRVLLLTKGKHTLTFRGREADTCIDKIIITNDMAFKPE